MARQRILENSGEESNLLASAALFKGEFSIDWLQDMTQARASEILSALEAGLEQGYLKRHGSNLYCISSPSKRKKLLDSITIEKRARMHKCAAEIILRELPETDTKVELVAYHFLHVTNDIGGCRWLVRAGNLHLNHYRIQEALECFKKAINDLQDLNNDEADNLLMETAIKYSKISSAELDPQTVIKALNQAKKRAVSRGDMSHQALLEMHIAKNEWLSSRFDASLKHFDKGLSLVSRIKEPKLERSARTFITIYPYWYGRFKEVVVNYEKVAPDIESLPIGKFSLFAGTIIGDCYAHTGQYPQGMGMLNGIREYCRAEGDLYTASVAGLGMGLAMSQFGNIQDAISCLEETIDEAKRGYSAWPMMWGPAVLANAYYKQNEIDRSVLYLQEFFKHSKRIGTNVMNNPRIMELGWANEEKNYPNVPGLSLRDNLPRVIRSKNIHEKGTAYRYKALLQKKDNQPVKSILRSLNLSFKFLEQAGHLPELLSTKMELARTLSSLGEHEKANEVMKGAADSLSFFNEQFIPDDFKGFFRDLKPSENILEEILSIGQELVAIKDNRTLIQHILNTAIRITGAERGAIFLLDENNDSNDLRLRATKSMTEETVAEPSFLASMKMIKDIVRTNKGQIIIAENPGAQQDPGGKKIRSRICVPMVMRNKTVGVLYHDNRLFGNAFKDSDLKILSFFAAQAAIAMDNANTYEEINRLNRQLKEEKHYYEEQHLESVHYEEIIGKSKAITKMLAKADQVAATDTTVLILGETGVGKELVARAIHKNSLRADKPFIRVHSSALPENLIPSELFGHEKGAFTGAISQRVGRFELADGGTIFLDEIGELALDIQIKLLRILQSKEFERVGGNETLHSDFRLILATNLNLEEEVKASNFRQDLFYRINVFPIYVPPLRERKDDIPLLAYYFLKIYSTKMGRSINKITRQGMGRLLEYSWPGNVRELENIIERSVILSRDGELHLPDLVTDWPDATEPTALGSLKEVEKRQILLTLEKTDGKVHGPGGAAELLEINPFTLASRMKKLGIKKPKKTWRPGTDPTGL